MYGVVSVRQVRTGIEGTRRITETTGGAFSKNLKAQDVRNEAEKIFTSFETLLKDLGDPKKSKFDSNVKFLEKFGEQIESIKKRFSEGFKETMSEISSKQTNKTALERAYSEGINSLLGGRNAQLNNQPITSLIDGNRGAMAQNATKDTTKTVEQKTTITLGGNIKVDLNLPEGFAQLDAEKQQKILDSIFNSQQFKQMVANLAADKNPTKQPVNTGYNR